MNTPCKQCGKVIRLRKNKRITGLCYRCYTKTRPPKFRLFNCSGCGKLKPYKAKNLCIVCWGKIPHNKVVCLPRSVCTNCGKVRRARRNRVTTLCWECYRNTLPVRDRLITCINCGELKPYKAKNLCDNCWQRLHHIPVPRSILGICKECGQQKIVNVKSDLCKLCVRRLHKRRYQRERCITDIGFKILTILRGQVGRLVKRVNKNPDIHTIKIIGCSIPQFKQHIEKQFKPGMSWVNYGRGGWHLDHIKPCAMFNLRNYDEVLKCFNYTNYQPLWEHDNCSKGARYIG